MIVPFTIDPKAFSVTLGELPPLLAMHESVLSQWREAGILFIPTRREQRLRFVEALDRLPQPIRVAWKAAVGHLWTVDDLEDCPDVASFRSLEDVGPFRGHVAMILLDPAKVGRIKGFPMDQGAATDELTGIELCRFDSVTAASAFRRAKDGAQAAIRSGTPLETIWNGRLEYIFRLSRTANIVDRYAVERLLRRMQASGLSRFLARLDRLGRTSSGHGRAVTIYSQIPKDDIGCGKTRHAMAGLLRTLCDGGIERVVLRLSPGRAFMKEAHDRHIRCGRHCAIEIGTGLAIFEAERVFGSTTFRYSADVRDHVHREDALERSAIPDLRFGGSASLEADRYPGRKGERGSA